MFDTRPTTHQVLKAPFGYPGGKQRFAEKIASHLPNRRMYVEPFGGAASVLLAKPPSELEVVNDKYGGVIDFYRCLQDPKMVDALAETLDLLPTGKEMFLYCQEMWCTSTDPVKRAAFWFYMATQSFGGIQRNWGRILKPARPLARKIHDRFTDFWKIHQRIKDVQFDNCDWHDCLLSYDSSETVFYMDPPYLDCYKGTYKNELSPAEHLRLLECIFKLDGFVAISGYTCKAYEVFPWDERHTWESRVSVNGDDESVRDYGQEVLWIKY